MGGIAVGELGGLYTGITVQLLQLSQVYETLHCRLSSLLLTSISRQRWPFWYFWYILIAESINALPAVLLWDSICVSNDKIRGYIGSLREKSPYSALGKELWKQTWNSHSTKLHHIVNRALSVSASPSDMLLISVAVYARRNGTFSSNLSLRGTASCQSPSLDLCGEKVQNL